MLSQPSYIVPHQSSLWPPRGPDYVSTRRAGKREPDIGEHGNKAARGKDDSATGNTGVASASAGQPGGDKTGSNGGKISFCNGPEAKRGAGDKVLAGPPPIV